jgi:hypothetical protein
MALTACASPSAPAETPVDPVYTIATKNSDDQIALQYQNNEMIIEINSPFGIGSATFTLESGQAPGKIFVRLHLAGLEEFRLISGDEAISVTVPSNASLKAQSQKKISRNGEQVLRPFDALWLEIKIVSKSNKIPLEEGYFEVVIPGEFVQKFGGSFEIQWIDFYR